MKVNVENHGEQQVESLLNSFLGSTRFGSWVNGRLVEGDGEELF